MTALESSSERPQSPQRPLSLVGEDPDLQARYEEYCRRQAKGLVSQLPKEAVRPLYARAREWGKETGREVHKDPLATLLLFIRAILPLPPLAIWSADRAQFLDAHLEEEFESPPAHRQSSPPVTVESRGMELNGERWRASLSLFHRDDAWRGFISFQKAGGGTGIRTGEIFREEDPEEIKDRFLGFHGQTLQAFLRSVLP
jgi:hypothetical protein